MITLSLFDGMSCGQVAMERAGLVNDYYFASEIDKYAIQIAKKNYPSIIHMGDVTSVSGYDLPKIDLLLGGSPCQGFSFAGKQLAFDDPRSSLFFEYVRILKELREINPDVKFLLENVRMKKEFLDIISHLLGVEPICINSALVSAQNRVRYYWTNIKGVVQPADKGLILEDVLEQTADVCHIMSDKSLQRMQRRKYSNPKILPDKTGTINTCNNSGRRCLDSGTTLIPVEFDQEPFWDGYKSGQPVPVTNKKMQTLRAGAGSRTRGIGNSDPSTGYWRKLTPLECERLQTLPDNYTEGVSNTQRYTMIGNGWTVDVIVHILRGLHDPNA